MIGEEKSKIEELVRKNRKKMTSFPRFFLWSIVGNIKIIEMTQESVCKKEECLVLLSTGKECFPCGV